jgi:hypothetical protein
MTVSIAVDVRITIALNHFVLVIFLRFSTTSSRRADSLSALAKIFILKLFVIASDSAPDTLESRTLDNTS